MKKFLVIGNPIEHSLSPKLHNYWIKKNNIKGNYEKLKINSEDLEKVIKDIKVEKLHGINVTVPFKSEIIKYLDELSEEAKKAFSVNTIYKVDDKIVGHNTDITGFELAIRHTKYDIQGKNVLILGAGGVVSSIILALKNLRVSKINLMNRTYEKALNLKKRFNEIEIKRWGESCYFDMVINATSLGLKKDDKINIDYEGIGENKFFYDVIYNPLETKFLKEAKKNFHRTENGKMMFIYQAHLSFTLWHKIMPEINDEVKQIIIK